jgi:TM2 domain-containing membrane protein YozV
MDASADRQYVTGPYDYTIAWLLMFFPLGVFGIHRFYLGKIATGLIWFFTGGLFGFGWLYDLWTLNEQVNDKNLESLHAA